MRFNSILIVLSTFFVQPALSQPNLEGKTFKPFEVTCSLTYTGVDGAEASTKSDPELVVSLEGRNTTGEGRRLLKKVGDYEFFVSTKGVLIGEKEKLLELADYTAEIYNSKTNLRVLSDSGDEVTPDKKSGANTIKIATVRLQNAGAELGMFCFHKPTTDKNKRLKLRH